MLHALSNCWMCHVIRSARVPRHVQLLQTIRRNRPPAPTPLLKTENRKPNHSLPQIDRRREVLLCVERSSREKAAPARHRDIRKPQRKARPQRPQRNTSAPSCSNGFCFRLCGLRALSLLSVVVFWPSPIGSTEDRWPTKDQIPSWLATSAGLVSCLLSPAPLFRPARLLAPSHTFPSYNFSQSRFHVYFRKVP
jgi:hypothetical protein